MNRFCVIVPAAGLGGRLGGPKISQMLQGEYFVNHIANVSRQAGIETTVCVKNASLDLKTDYYNPDLIWVENHHIKYGMLHSIYCGINGSPHFGSYIIWPVDHPLVSPDTLNALAAQAVAHPQCLVKPVFDGRSGHPVILPGTLAGQLPSGHFEGGLRKWLHINAVPIHVVKVEDEGVVININKPEDLEHARLAVL